MNSTARAAAVSAALVALVGCTSTPAGATSSSSSSTSSSSSSSSSSSGGGFRAACEFDSRPGRLRSQGGSQMMINGEVYVGCGGGPTIHLKDVDGDTVTFARKSDEVRVAKGATEQVGPYRVRVTDVQGERVEFEMSRPDS